MYFPKSRISKPLQSTSGDFININGTPYIGTYYKTYDNRFFTGTSPLDKTTKEIKKIPPRTNRLIHGVNNSKYQSINTDVRLSEFIEPKPHIVIPTEIDYSMGKITRYFAKERKIRIFKIIEINKETFQDISNQEGIYNYPGWDVISMFWQISGPKNNIISGGNIVKVGIEDTNKRIIDIKNKNFIGLKEYLTNLTQYSKL